MFLCTANYDISKELENKGFRFICKQHQGESCLYTFEFKPSFFALFNDDDRKEVFVSDRMTMA